MARMHGIVLYTNDVRDFRAPLQLRQTNHTPGLFLCISVIFIHVVEHFIAAATAFAEGDRVSA